MGDRRAAILDVSGAWAEKNSQSASLALKSCEAETPGREGRVVGRPATS